VNAAAAIKPPLPSSRQARAAETRARIFAAAAELFSKDGYQTTTVDKIAAAAGVAKGTFFVHFKSKDAVIAELVRVQTSSARKARARALESDGPLAALRAAVITLGEHAAASRALSRGVITAILESHELGGAATELFDELLREMVDDARSAKRAGMLARGVSPEVLAQSLLVSYLGSVLHFTSNRKGAEIRSVLAPIVDAQLSQARLKRPSSR
jgi:AcrR family transcriptional regulator